MIFFISTDILGYMSKRRVQGRENVSDLSTDKLSLSILLPVIANALSGARRHERYESGYDDPWGLPSQDHGYQDYGYGSDSGPWNESYPVEYTNEHLWDPADFPGYPFHPTSHKGFRFPEFSPPHVPGYPYGFGNFVDNWFGPAERPGFYPPVFKGFAGSAASQFLGMRPSGPLGGLDGYGAGFVGPVGGLGGTVVGYNDGRGQGGPLGGLYSTLLGTAGWGHGGFGGGGWYPDGMFSGFQHV